MIGIVDYGAGNLANLERALARIGVPSRVLTSPEESGSQDITGLILPGIGSFGSAARSLEGSGWSSRLLEWAGSGLPLIGICLGMQLMFERSLEDGDNRGLGIFRGVVEPFKGSRVIHMGWDRVRWLHSPPAQDGEAFYFVHRYCCYRMDDAWGVCGSPGHPEFLAAARRGSTMGFQFHPERSGPKGLDLLRNAIREVTGGWS
ncbi:imidazole glycerol phosphate synthase, glutamine amidotransferase subunit [Thermanaerovibrio velox DSM 12556]|uniref:Imidazole glycerol phosphate synthase, glutamine amidotransferase subunit n=1 Tax=Thermanaerovibrio velox DSM 12556 TaxID=926567 RepID=H0UQ52_9BACT|nr:imidazole glycerol phosphate synthase subunit HisH [Thermanaerovibrio velox]EHM10690.1 imidazole glycerol phosphate synthase, glutamine amidotransferase subunit [Thermanaerovibrio velox DSM 12556]